MNREIFEDISIKTHKLNFLDEIAALRALAEEIGEESPCYQRLVSSLEYLSDYRYIFSYADYANDCMERTPKWLREQVSSVFKHKEPMEFVDPL